MPLLPSVPLGEEKNINYNLILNKPQKRGSILISSKRNSLEFSDTKIIEELNLIIKNKFTVSCDNEIVLNLNVKPFAQVLYSYSHVLFRLFLAT